MPTNTTREARRADVFALVRASGEIASVYWKREDAYSKATHGPDEGLAVVPVAVVDRAAVSRPDVRALRDLVDAWRENAAEEPAGDSLADAAERRTYAKCARSLRGLLDVRPQPDIRAFEDAGRAAADAIARGAATVTLDAGLVEVVLSENAKRAAVLRRCAETLARYADEVGGCDHSVNVCACGLFGLLGDVRELLVAMPGAETSVKP